MTWLTAVVALASMSGVARVVDGDTLRIDDVRIRLYGIDAPELRQRCGSGSRRTSCGRDAAAWLRRMVNGRTLDCATMDIDRYGRTVAICRVGGRDLGEAMVRRGLALAYRRYADRYVAAEDAARKERLGMWSGGFQSPSYYRAVHRGEGLGRQDERPLDPGCMIKGNVSTEGARIYHLPGGRGYAKVRISPRKGERWFCSEADALAAGWRSPR